MTNLRRYRICVSLLLLTSIAGCLNRPPVQTTSNPQSRSAVVTNGVKELPINDMIWPAVITQKEFVFVVKNQDGTSVAASPIAIKVQLSTDKAGSGWEDLRTDDVTRPNAANMAVITAPFKDKLTGVRFLKISVKGQDDAAEKVYYVKYRDYFTVGVGAPVLFKVDGSAGSFATDAFAPSLGAVLKWHTQSEGFPYWGVLPLVSVYRSEVESDSDRPYSLVAGAAFDLGGWLQVGGSYHFKTKNPALIIGARPEAIAALFGKAK